MSDHPWDRLDDEPAPWFARFDRYRLLGPSRTLEETWRGEQNGAERSGKRAPGSWCEQARRWRWRQRAEAWDAVQRAARQAERLAELEEAQARHRLMARLMQEKAIQTIRAIKPEELSRMEALRYLLDGIDLERRSIEEPAILALQLEVDDLKRQQRQEESAEE
jgi:hypothetical protein